MKISKKLLLSTALASTLFVSGNVWGSNLQEFNSLSQEEQKLFNSSHNPKQRFDSNLVNKWVNEYRKQKQVEIQSSTQEHIKEATQKKETIEKNFLADLFNNNLESNAKSAAVDYLGLTGGGTDDKDLETFTKAVSLKKDNAYLIDKISELSYGIASTIYSSKPEALSMDLENEIAKELKKLESNKFYIKATDNVVNNLSSISVTVKKDDMVESPEALSDLASLPLAMAKIVQDQIYADGVKAGAVLKSSFFEIFILVSIFLLYVKIYVKTQCKLYYNNKV